MSERIIFERALDFDDPEQRDAFLAQACSGDATLRSRIEALLRSHEQSGGFLHGDAIDSALQIDLVTEQPGDSIGPYQLLEQIGEGGMGLVYLAEQTRPIQRRVALKIIKPGMDIRQVVARFEAERQTLAMMDHPHIAKVHDAGSTDTGRPYFVMELVHGVPITEYCDQCNLTTRERLELFVTVCQAVQHAHQRGIIHRDIKPTNILVAMQDGQPAPKIIDFGVAKAINPPLSEQTITNVFTQMVGTPLYMSPEQAELSPMAVDTRSDVYSLGVLLYELLTGQTPFDTDQFRDLPYEGMRRMIREQQPPRPSARVSTLSADLATTIAERRRTDARRLIHTIRGELDWIVMKALEKDRMRRYDSAGALALDVQRHLDGEQVEACPPSRRYVLKKLMLRHKTLFAATAAVILALALGVVATTWEGMVARRTRNAALAAERRAIAAEERATRNLQRALNAVDQTLRRVGQDQLQHIPRMQTVRQELLQDAVELYRQFLEDAPDNPRVRLDTAITQRRLAEVHLHLGNRPLAESAIEQSLQLLNDALRDSPENERVQLELARSQLLAGSVLDRLEPLQQAVAILGKLNPNGTAHRDAAIELAFAFSRIGGRSDALGAGAQAEQTFAEAEKLFEDLLARHGQDRELRRACAKHLVNFGQFIGRTGNWQGEEAKLDHALAIGQVLIESDPQSEDLLIYATALLNRGAVKSERAVTLSSNDARDALLVSRDTDFDDAIRWLRKLVDDDPSVPLYRERLAGALSNVMAFSMADDRAVEAGNESLELFRRLVEEFPAEVAYRRAYGAALGNMAMRLQSLGGDLKHAERLARDAIEQQLRALEANPQDPIANTYLVNHHILLADMLIARDAPPVEVVDVCVNGLKVAEQMQSKYPENQAAAWRVHRLHELMTATEQATSRTNESDVVEQSP